MLSLQKSRVPSIDSSDFFCTLLPRLQHLIQHGGQGVIAEASLSAGTEVTTCIFFFADPVYGFSVNSWILVSYCNLHSFSVIQVFDGVRYHALGFDGFWQGRCLDQTFQNPHGRHCSTQGKAIVMKDLSKRNIKKNAGKNLNTENHGLICSIFAWYLLNGCDWVKLC